MSPRPDWQQRYAHILDELDPPDRRVIVTALHNGALEDLPISELQVRTMVDAQLGRITSADAVRALANGVPGRPHTGGDAS